MDNNNCKIGILAYGSLIDDPGEEISNVAMEKRISCETPFKVEYGRSSSGRDGAPTLIPFEEGGARVKAQIIVLNNDITLEKAKNILYRRETRSTDNYQHSEKPGVNKVLVKELSSFKNIETVLYTSIGKNIEGKLSGSILAEYAVESLKMNAGKNGEDGVSYLLNAISNGIVTPLTKEYEKSILALTNFGSLEEVIQNRNKLQ